MIIYQTVVGATKVDVRFENETVWLNQAQIAELFGCSSDNVGLHLKNIYKEDELDVNSTTEEISVVRIEGNRSVKRNIVHYNLDAVLLVLKVLLCFVFGQLSDCENISSKVLQ